MKIHSAGHRRGPCLARAPYWFAPLPFVLLLIASAPPAAAQDRSQLDLQHQIQQLTDAVARTQAQLEQSQKQLDALRKELLHLQLQVAEGSGEAPARPASADSVVAENNSFSNAIAELGAIKERQAVQESQIATHEQAKVESASKYPVKITGLLLFNGFVNTRQVDMPATPTIALPGTGSTGASVKQTILGFDANGPRLFGGRSYADLRIDFDGTPQTGSGGVYSGAYSASSTLLRLRTAHAGIRWPNLNAAFSYDRPLMSPETPTSLIALAEPALAWSGNLWTWNPQVGAMRDIGFGKSHALRLQAALLDVGDAPYSTYTPASGTSPIESPSAAQQSRWPGIEARVAVLDSSRNEEGNRLGFGGYFSPHRTAQGYSYDAWAASLDAHLVLPLNLQVSVSAYRGQALGGLGGGGFKDLAYRPDYDTGGFYYRPLDDVGGWAQLKEKVSNRLEFNSAVGMDELFESELRRYAVAGGTMYQNLVANRTYTGNVIYSPSAYLLFSLEYRHLHSTPVIGGPSASDVIGIAAGYRF